MDISLTNPPLHKNSSSWIRLIKPFIPPRLRKFLIDLLYVGYRFKHRQAEIYANPTPDQFHQIEVDFINLGVSIHELMIDEADFKKFTDDCPFPSDYHGGHNGGVWYEKIFEHFIAFKLLDLKGYSKDDKYVDCAAKESPWAMLLRKYIGIQAYAIDLEPSRQYGQLDYYQQQDATATTFLDCSVRGVSLQCAYELFAGKNDVALIYELNRILESGGKAVIIPLYMHTHNCCYASPEYFGKGLADDDSKEYLRKESRGIHSSRKYSARKLQERILKVITLLGMSYRLLVVRNKEIISKDIYCHFVLEITK